MDFTRKMVCAKNVKFKDVIYASKLKKYLVRI